MVEVLLGAFSMVAAVFARRRGSTRNEAEANEIPVLKRLQRNTGIKLSEITMFELIFGLDCYLVGSQADCSSWY